MMRLRGARTAWRNRQSDLRKLERSGRAIVGYGTYGTPRCLTFKHDSTGLQIGAYCSIGEGVTFVLGGGHPTNEVTTFPLRMKFNLPGAGGDSHPLSKGDVVVGSDVWIGAGATILSGVHIGDGAVIGAGSVVARSVEPYAIVAGNPATVIRKRFTEDQIAALLRISWWAWDPTVIIAAVSSLSSANINDFIGRYDRYVGEQNGGR